MKDGFFIVALLPRAKARTEHAVEIVVLLGWGVSGGGGGGAEGGFSC